MRSWRGRPRQICDLKELVAKSIPEVIGEEIDQKATAGIYPRRNTFTSARSRKFEGSGSQVWHEQADGGTVAKYMVSIC